MLAARNRARERTGNPVAEDERRRLGERDDDETPPGTVDEAAARLASALPVVSRETWAQMGDGHWVCRETGLVLDEPPARCTL